VGFPGETDARFNELLDFVKRARFDHLGCFTFYPEQGTPAARFPHQIPRHIKKHRFDEIMKAQQHIVFEKNKSRVGETLTCLIDSVNEKRKTAAARYFGQAPQIDPVCIIKNCNASSGDFIKAKIVGSKGYDLLCEQI
jgi:ribosomal protein S12 methylthiotransferase